MSSILLTTFKNLKQNEKFQLPKLRFNSRRNENDLSSLSDLPRENNDSATSPRISDEDYPEGGFDAWCSVLGSFLGLTNCFGTINSISAIETYIAHNQLKEYSAAVVGWIFSIYLCISLLFGIFTGDFYDKKGPKIPILVGGILTFLGTFLTGNCSKIYQFILCFGIISGMGAAVQSGSLIGVLSQYFDKKRGLAVGIATIGSSVGGAIFPLMLRKLYVSLGFIWAMRIFAFLLLLLDLGAYLLIKPRFGPVNNNKKSFVEYLKNTIDFKYFKEPRFFFLVLAVTFAESFLVTSMTYYGSYSIFKKNSEDTSYLLITIMNAVGIIARMGAGYFSDKIGKFNLMIILTFLASLFCLIIWLPFGKYITGLYIHSICFGISSAAVLSLTPLCVGQISRVEEFGKRYSACYFFVAIGCLILIPISGLFIGKNPSNQNYDNFIIFTSVLGFSGVGCYVISRWFAVRFKLCIY